MIDYEDLILQRQELQEIYEDDSEDPVVKWWDDIPEEDFICRST